MNCVRDSVKKHKFYSLCPSTDGRNLVRQHYNIHSNDCIVISLSKIIGIPNTYKPNDAILALASLNINTIIIYDIYPFDITYGYVIETMFSLYSTKYRFIYILYLYDYSDFFGWIKDFDISIGVNEIDYKVQSFFPAKNDFLFESKLNYKLLPYIYKKTIIRTATIKCCISGVKYLISNVNTAKRKCYVNSFTGLILQESVQKGIGYLHSNMDEDDKAKILDLYNEGSINCLITTQVLTNLKCDTYIIKTTKKYTKDGYKEYMLQEIVDCARCINKNGTLNILTEKEMHKYYVNIFCSKKLPSYFDYASKTQDCNFSILEKHLPEFVIYNLLLQTTKSGKIEIMLQKTFFYYNLVKVKNDFDCSILVESVFQDLLDNKFIDKSYNLNKDLAMLFCECNISYIQFAMFVQKYVSVEKLANDIAKISKLCKNKRQTFYEALLANKIDKSTEMFKKYTENIELIIKIKKATGYNLSVAVILFCQLLSDKCTRKIKELNTNANVFYNDSARIVYNENKIDINVSQIYFLIIENEDNVLLETQVQNNFTALIAESSYNLYLLNIYDYSKSIMLIKKSTNLTINEKFYCVFSNYQANNKTTTKQETNEIIHNFSAMSATKREYVNGVYITLYLPKSVQQNM
ncbi:hypothetical protein BDAP_001312 [Binucleata daphniae]